MQSVKYVFDAIGTGWKIDIYSSLSSPKKKRLYILIKDAIGKYDSVYSRFRSDSEISRISKKPGVYYLPVDSDTLFSLYEKLYYLTQGAFTPLIGQVLTDAGYDSNYSLVNKRKLKKPPPWNDVIKYHSFKLTLKKPAILDFGAGGKGHLIDIIGKLLRDEKIDSYCIDAGGDILYQNIEKKPIRVGLENPNNASEVIGVVPLLNKSICGSSGNRRKWGKFSHIINPHTLSSQNNILATWVISDIAITADALATCLFFVHPDVLKKDYNFEYLILNSDFSIDKSPHFSGEIFYK